MEQPGTDPLANRDSWLIRNAERAGVRHGLDPAALDPAFVARQVDLFETLYGPNRYFDTHVRGLDHVPAAPVMLVSNHSGGTTVLDGFGFMVAWYRRFGVQRPIHGLAHEVVFASRRTGRYFERGGILRARSDIAHDVVGKHQRDLIVMPGGDRDVWRPASKRFQVTFAGRSGYARTALELGIPIVPMVHVGAHHTLHVLTDGAGLARRLRFIRALARAEVLPIHLSLPWGVAVGPWPHLPPPGRFDYVLGRPIRPAGPATPAAVDALDQDVQRAMQAMLDNLALERGARPSLPTVRRAAARSAESARSVAAFVRVLRSQGQLPDSLSTVRAGAARTR